MRKLLLSVVCLLLMSGLVLATEYTILAYDKEKKVIALKDKGGNEVAGRLTEKTKVTRIKKDGSKAEGDVTRVEKMLSGEDVAGKKIEATVEKGEITEITTKGGKKPAP
ncbi:MAG: hypothetical protein JWO38_2081 [Gemmataceae bacterium]|nr:hypothetical protein [Gemmataceae bacterium]